MKTILSNTIRGHNGSINDPKWKDVETLIELLARSGGSIGLDILDEDNYLQKGLDVRSESKKYLLTYFVPIEDIGPGSECKKEVFSLFNFPDKSGQAKIDLCGDYWDPTVIGTDISVVLRAFREFFEHREIDMRSYGVSDT